MINYLFKILIFLGFSSIVIYNYYFQSGHIENFDGYFPYLITVAFLYGLYKYIQVNFSSKKDIATFTPLTILGFFLLHLFILCGLFFVFNANPFISGMILFFKILFYSLLPTMIILISIAFGKKLVFLIHGTHKFSFLHDIFSFLHKKNTLQGADSKENFFVGDIHNSSYLFLLSLGLGFVSFVSGLTVIGMLGFYNLFALFFLLVSFFMFSYKEFFAIVKNIFGYQIELNIKEGGYLKLISTEFFFLIATLLLSVNLISIVRPFPIGWDDLGVYMNFPHLMAEAGSVVSLGGMYAWQVFTGIGYMFGSTTQAFFMNVVGGFMSVIVLVFVIKDLLKDITQSIQSKKERIPFIGYEENVVGKTFLDIPMMLSAIFIALPMIVFQQSKDMKLDAGFFFLSVIAVYLLYKFFMYHHEEYVSSYKHFSLKEFFKKSGGYLLIIGILVGFAFAVKFTALLLILGMIGLLFFQHGGLTAFLGYIAFFFALFTKANLWSYMSVVMNPNHIPHFETYFSIIAGIIGLLFFIIAFYKKKQSFILLCMYLLVFLVGIMSALLPWTIKNSIESYPNISISALLSGKVDAYIPDYSHIYSLQQVQNIKDTINKELVSYSGSTNNEDFGRYFGYEKGLNNYIKLPWNLTMQKNQGGEFTDIGFLFLALLPVIFLFFPYKRESYVYFIPFVLLLELAIFVNLKLSPLFTNIFSHINIPLGYAVLGVIFILPIIYFMVCLKQHNFKKLFIVNLVFSSFYVFLWLISAFGIVWYGIVMYFCFFLSIALGGYFLSNYSDYDEEKENFVNFSQYFGVKLLSSLALLGVVGVYVFFSVIPHTFNNLKDTSYQDYKLGKMNTDEAVFLYHRDYLKILFELNIADDAKALFIDKNIQGDYLKNLIKQKNIGTDIYTVVDLLKYINTSQVDMDNQPVPMEIKKQASASLQNLYSGIGNPSDEFKNKAIIYNVGTFLRYHISENYKRLFGDGLLFELNNYLYNQNPVVTIENMKKMGVKYLLTDLNAATIDRDARHNLTSRYNKLLMTFLSPNLELVETDSMCLKVAIEKFREDQNFADYMVLAGVNYESYEKDSLGNEVVVNRGQKLTACYQYMYKLVKENKINEEHYSFLMTLLKYMNNNTKSFDTEEKVYQFLHSQFGNSFKALFKIIK